jgi:hypothetical protein
VKLWVLGTGDLSLATELQHASLAWPSAPSEILLLENPVQDALRSAGPRDFLALWGTARTTLQEDWRALLSSATLSFQVFYGSRPQMLENLAYAWSSHVGSPSALRSEILPRWEGVCETCSDPACEHRLFSRLLTGPEGLQ